MSAADIIIGAYLLIGLATAAALWSLLDGAFDKRLFGPDAPRSPARREVEDLLGRIRFAQDNSPRRGVSAFVLILMLVAAVLLWPLPGVLVLFQTRKR